MGNLVKKALRSWPILLICLLAVIFRLWRLEELFYFTYDEAVPAFVGRRLLLWHHIPLIGGATPFGFHLGPYFYWFYSGLLSLTNLNPISWGYAGAVISFLTTFLIYKVGERTGSKKVAITVAIFWAFSLIANVYDRHFWALYWGPPTGLLTIYSLLKIKEGKAYWTIILSVVLALSFHADLSNLIFIGAAILSFLIFKYPQKFKKITILIIVFLISQAPLVAFDLRHDFSNTKPFLKFIERGNNNPGFSIESLSNNSYLFPSTFSRLIYKFGDGEISKDYSYCPSYIEERTQATPLLFILFTSILLLAFALYARKKETPLVYKLSAIILALYFVGIQLYGTIFKADVFEHYIAGLFPILFLIFARFVSKLPKPIWLAVIATFVFTNLTLLSKAENKMSLKDKGEAIEYIYKEVGNNDFSIDSLSTCWKYSGYRYLFTVYGKEPVKSYVDPNFGYLYETTPIADNHPDFVAIFVVHDFQKETEEYYKRYAQLKEHQISSSMFGNIEVIIVDNKARWF